MCPSSTCGRPGISTSHMHMECTIFSSGNLMLRGLDAICTFFLGVSAITNTVVAPISAIPCVLGISGHLIWMLWMHTSHLDALEVTTVLLLSSKLFIWVGYKTGSSINDFIHLNPNCSAPHHHMVGSCDLCIAFVHASYPTAIYCPELAWVYPLDDLCVSRGLGMFWMYPHKMT